MTIYEQIKNLFEKSLSIFLLAPQEMDGDRLGSALALFYTLKKLNKNVNLVLQNIPEKFKFLPIPEYLNSLNAKKAFTISLANTGEKVSEIYFDKEKEDLKIHFFSKEGDINEKDFSFTSQNLNPDLLIILGAKNFDDFGRIFKGNPQIFYDKPILNIDNNSDNEKFGEINLIDTNSSGVSEIVGEFLKECYENLIDEKIAISLLTGIIAATQNFQNQITSPKNLSLSSYLIEKGGSRLRIIQNLYKPKDIKSLKLMGQVLENLNFNKEKEFYWAALTEEHFRKSDSSSKDLGNILEELKVLSPASLLLLWESYGSGKVVRGIFYSSKKDLIEKISRNYENTQKGKGVLFLVRIPDIGEAEKEILNILI